jgi:phosphoglucosamine mutase
MSNVAFGADGIRYVAGKWPFNRPTAVKIGRALGRFLAARSDHPVAVIGRDTRPSGEWLANCLESGLDGEGVDVIHMDIMTTPGVAYVTRRLKADLGLSVSASHNPVEYNGIKLVGRNGLRLQREDELEIEKLIAESLARPNESHEDIGQRTIAQHFVELYIQEHVQRCPVESLEGLKIILDCANGAAASVAPAVFRRLGAEVTVINQARAGNLINQACGSEYVREHPQKLAWLVRKKGAVYGLAFDGDGDRLVIVDARGTLFDGNDLLFALAQHYHARSKLRGNAIVTTEMANGGLVETLQALGIKTIRAGKGDRSLEAAMWGGDYVLGGEPTGNIIINDGHHTAADAVFAALALMGMLRLQQCDLSEMIAPLQKYPQVVLSVHLAHVVPLEEIYALREQRNHSLANLHEGCRIMIWYSSTEPGIFRVMVEGTRHNTLEQVLHEAHAICHVAQKAASSEQLVS